MKTPKWVQQKQLINNHKEELVFIGEMGVAGVIDGKLPNGEQYQWSKRNRRRLKRPKG